ncbi:hypothetical protein LEP1GSC170_4516 [Leptospira interrogans serovar Bataviae str. HAI135]|nr:hypothetical protein LEP1GSC170_4516 [Leptospira interrogans serovar Bataviae str. HAI135]
MRKKIKMFNFTIPNKIILKNIKNYEYYYIFIFLKKLIIILL